MTQKTDILYILGTGSRWYNNEIKYSVRSIEKHLEGFGRIFVCGELPRFFDSRRFIHIPACDPAKHKLLNAMHKIRIACLSNNLSENFVLMNDDFIFMKNTDKIPNYNLGTIEENIKNHRTKAGYYYKALVDTLEYLRKKGIKDPLSFEVHYPMILNKQKFLELIEPIYYEQNPILFRSVYGNLAPLRSTFREDVKVYDLDDFHAIGGKDLISTDNRVCTEAEVQMWFERMFPEASKCEKV